MGLTLRPPYTALLGQTGKPLSGGVAHRHLGMPYPARIRWPAWTETLPWHKAGLYGCDDLGQPRGTECAAACVGYLAHQVCAQAGGNSLDVFYHVRLPPFLDFRLFRRRGFFQRESDLKVIVINNQSDRSLPGLASHPVEKVP